MAYFSKPSLVARSPGLSGWTDTIGDVAKGALTFFGSQQKAAGAAEALAAQNQALINAQSNRGISTETVVIGAAAVGAIAFLLLRKKKAA
jgi:hypothetical protein